MDSERRAFLPLQDDTNTVPFFDVELPKEITIKIFGHLNATDLGRCAQVGISQVWCVCV